MRIERNPHDKRDCGSCAYWMIEDKCPREHGFGKGPDARSICDSFKRSRASAQAIKEWEVKNE